MLRVDDYIKMLEKRASNADGGATGFDYNHDVVSSEDAIEAHKKNLTDNRQTLGSLFNNMESAQKAETSLAKRLFPSNEKHESSAPLVKLAGAVLSSSERFQSLPTHYKAAAVRAFTNELEKIASAAAAVGALVPTALGGMVGYNYGKAQKERGEKYRFGGAQVASLLIPGGAGYQIGRGLAHSSTPASSHPSPNESAKTAGRL